MTVIGFEQTFQGEIEDWESTMKSTLPSSMDGEPVD